MKHLTLSTAFGILSLSISVMARSSVYFSPMTYQPSQTPVEVSLNTFSAWMSHLTGTSDMYSFSQGELHQQKVLQGLQDMWDISSLKALGTSDIFENVSKEQQSMIIINGVERPSDILPFQTPNVYVDDNNAVDFKDVALDTMFQYQEKTNTETQKIDNVLSNLDTNNIDELIDAFKFHYSKEANLFDTENKAIQTFIAEVETIRKLEPKGFNVIEMNGLQLISKEYGTDSMTYQQAQSIINDFINKNFNQQEKGTTLILTPPSDNDNNNNHIHTRQQAPDQRIDLTTDFQLLFWTGIFLILLTSGVVTFAFSLGNSESGGVVLTTTLPKQD
ncbi:unnamed protein product [Cunninghamella blakesleeana]